MSKLNSDSEVSDVLYALGIACQNKEEYVAAKKWYQKAVDLGNIEAMNDLALLQYEIFNERKLAEDLLKEAINKDSSNVTFVRNLAKIYKGEGLLDLAEKLLLKSLNNAYDSSCLCLLGSIYDTKYQTSKNPEHFNKAKEYYVESVKLGNKVAMHNMGFLLHKSGDIQGAKDYYNKAIELNYPESMCNLAIICETIDNDTNTAKQLLNKASDLGCMQAKFALMSMDSALT
jgi:TPR repeat protein